VLGEYVQEFQNSEEEGTWQRQLERSSFTSTSMSSPLDQGLLRARGIWSWPYLPLSLTWHHAHASSDNSCHWPTQLSLGWNTHLDSLPSPWNFLSSCQISGAH
jgi:hypothetical protein